MFVYGDREEQVDPVLRVREINREIDTAERMPAGIERHARLGAALIDTGQLLQGLADASFAEHGSDRRSAVTDALTNSLLELAGAMCRSWDSRFERIDPLPPVELVGAVPPAVELRQPEGFAFYAVYVEAYVEAARRLQLSAPPRVIGIRSIGTTLAAVVAAALRAPAPVTVRPFGDPNERRIAVDPALERDLLEGDAHYVIVDEGPGQSGSSFGAAADWLRDRGVPNERIAVIPSHAAAPGPAATDARRRWWGEVQRQVGDFGERWPGLIARWCSDVIGDLDHAPRDISAGAWRRLRCAEEGDWPASVPAWERRKYVVRVDSEPFLVKFAGFGRIAKDKLAMARALHCEGFVPEPVGLVHGFLVERWIEDAAPLTDGEKPLRDVARYLAARARLLPATKGSGASVEALLTMARRNIALELGEAAGGALDVWSGRADALERRVMRVRTDNKLDRHEWLRTGSGALVKTDAVDHHQSHDIVGCQDLAWDVAGAIAEFGVRHGELDHFVAAIEQRSNRGVDRELLQFYAIAYRAFRLGQCRLGAAMAEDHSERRRLGHYGDRYAAELQHLLQRTEAATRLETSVD